MKNISRRVLASTLAFIIVFSQLALLGIYEVAYATDTSTSVTNHANVEFDAYFEGETRETVLNMDSEKSTKLYLKLIVKEAGYLKNGVIQISNANFEIDENYQSKYIQKIENNKIFLNQIQSEETMLLQLPISLSKEEKIPVDYFTRNSEINFSSIYVDARAEENAITAQKSVKLQWHGAAKIVATVSLNKYVPYNVNGEYGVLVQTKVNTSLENNSLPISNTQINITVPEINGQKPNLVKVTANHTKATNGNDNGYKFTTQNWTYGENGILNIQAQNNADASNNILWKKGVTDEFVVTYIYNGDKGQELYNYAINNEIDFATNMDVEISAYNDVQTDLKETFSGSVTLKNKINEIVDFELLNVTNQINKGQIYANYDAKDPIEVEYEQQYLANIGYAQITDYIEFNQEEDTYLTDDNKIGNTIISNVNYVYNKIIKIDTNEFENILGENGFIEIYDESKTKIGTIDSNSKNGNVYKFDLSNLNKNKITLKTSKPVSEGYLKINITKAIVGKQAYSKEQMTDFKNFKIGLIGKTNLSESAKQIKINFIEPITEATLSIGTQNLSTVVENKNVELRVVLNTSDTSKSLYKNPVIKIKLPASVEEVTIEKDDILFDDELKIKETKVIEENGHKVIRVTLEGLQTKYNTQTDIKGANIVLKTNIKLKITTPNTKEKIVMHYTNENSSLYAKVENNSGVDEKEVEFVAPTGVVVAAGISNYRDVVKGEEEKSKELISVTEGSVIGTLNIFSPARIATVKGFVINNYNNKISNVEILGRIPFKGNKNIDTNKNLNTTFDATLNGAISVVGIDSNLIKVYYSSNGDATKDLTNAANNWQETVTDYTKIKSYLIVVQNQELDSGAKIEFAYDINVPANLSHNNDAFSNYKVYYKNIDETAGTKEEAKVSPLIGISTGRGAELQATVKSNLEEGTEVRESQIVKYVVTIKNIGETIAENVKIKIEAPHNATHIEYILGDHIYSDMAEEERIIDVGSIAPGETVQKEYEMKMKSVTEVSETYNKYEIEMDDEGNIIGEKVEEITRTEEEIKELDEKLNTVVSKVSLVAENIAGEIPSNEYKLKLIKGYFYIDMVSMMDTNTVLKKGDTSEITATIKNLQTQSVENVLFEMDIPLGATISDAKILNTLLDQKGNTEGIELTDSKLKINIGNLESLEVIYVQFTLNIADADEQVKLVGNVSANNISKHSSNEILFEVDEVKLQIEQKAISNRTVKEGSEFKYSFTIKNIGTIRAENTTIENVIPEGTEFVKAEYNYDTKNYTVSQTYSGAMKISVSILEPGQTLNITVTLKAGTVKVNEEKEVENYATLSSKGFDTIESNKITYYIEDDPNLPEQSDPSNPSNPPSDKPVDKKYKIEGTAWIDENRDGKRDTNEQILSNIPVILINKENNAIVKDVDTNAEKRTTTGEDGKYQFSNLEKGEYLVIFAYDASKYSLTDYQGKDIDITLNSDAIDMNMVLDGERRVVGITDVIKITDSNIRDIDIGVYVSEKFDLRLDKYISKITLTTPTIGTKTYNYDNKKAAKIEVLGSNLGKSNMAIEYKIVITNEGAVAGYVGKVVDYLPEEVKFSTDLNKDWYLADNGNVYNSSLEKIKINPGESKELSLVVTMRITESNLDVLNNKAEIYESYNELALTDIDSIPGNGFEDEDDISEAEVVVGLVTGTIIKYITIALGIIVICGLGIYGIKMKVLNRQEN